MKTKSFPLVLFSLSSLGLLAQQSSTYQKNRQKNLDSLYQTLAWQNADTNKIKTLIALMGLNTFPGANIDTTRFYYQQASSLSKQLRFSNGIISANEMIGLAFYNSSVPDSAKLYYRAGLHEAAMQNNLKRLAKLYLMMGWINTTQQVNSDSALHNFISSYEYALKANDTSQILSGLFYVGLVHVSKHDYLPAVRNFLQLIPIAEKAKDYRRLISTYTYLASIFAEMKQEKEVKEILLKAESIARLLNDTKELSMVYDVRMENFYRSGQYDSVFLYAERIRNLKILFQDPYVERNYYRCLGHYYLWKGDIAAAKRYFDSGLVAVAPGKVLLASIYLGLGKCAFKEKKYQQSLQFYQQAEAEIASEESAGEQVELLDHYHELYSAMDNYKLALKTLERQKFLEDSMVAVRNDFSVNYLNLHFETSKKENQIKLLSAENKLNTVLASKQRQQKRNAYLLIGTILVLGSYIFYRYMRRKKLQAQRDVVNERLRISRELHDELGATLSGVALYSEIAKQKMVQHNEEDAQIYLEHISTNSKYMVEKMGDIIWTINPENDSMERIVAKLKSYAVNLCSGKNIQIHFHVDEAIKNSFPGIQERRNIYLFSKEAINNAVKYSAAANIFYSIKKTGNKVVLEIRDDGKGFDKDSVVKGNGLNNMQARAEELKAGLDIQSKTGAGTSIRLSLNFHPTGGQKEMV